MGGYSSSFWMGCGGEGWILLNLGVGFNIPVSIPGKRV